MEPKETLQILAFGLLLGGCYVVVVHRMYAWASSLVKEATRSDREPDQLSVYPTIFFCFVLGEVSSLIMHLQSGFVGPILCLGVLLSGLLSGLLSPRRARRKN